MTETTKVLSKYTEYYIIPIIVYGNMRDCRMNI